jgi:hypothetical protein
MTVGLCGYNKREQAGGEKLVQQFFCALDRAYYGNAVTNVGMRHDRIVFKHMGTSQQNLHYAKTQFLG